MSNLLSVSLIVIFLTACFAPFLAPVFRKAIGWALAVVPATIFACLLSQVGVIQSGEVLTESFEWFPSLGIIISLKLDGLSYLMSLLITGIGSIIFVYAGGYMHGHPQLGRFYCYLAGFMGAMLGLVLSDNLLLLFVFWELTSITSYLLIGFNHEEKESRWKALQALLVTGLGAMGMMAGFILIGNIAGSFNISEINLLSSEIQASPYYTAIILLVLFGAFTKSAQIPFHFWLPNAMAGPTPVSAYLHSATMVKAGVFLLARMTPSLGGTETWGFILAITGSLTLLLAVFLGILQTDLKRILAYTTLAVLGMLVMLIGVGGKYAIQAMIVFLLGHALYKATLFMTCGSIDHETGTRDVRIIRGLRSTMPITMCAAILAALSKCGFPPFVGFLGKELIYKSTADLEGFAIYFLVAAFVGNLLVMALALNAGVAPFLGKSNDAALPKHPHEAPPSMWVGPVILAVTGLAFGLFPDLVANTIVAPAVAACLGKSIDPIHLELWHGVNLPLILSAFTLLGGFFAFAFRKKLWACGASVLAAIRPYGAEAVYESIFNGVVYFSKKQTRWLQTGRLHDYIFMILATTLGFLVWAIIKFGGLDFDIDLGSLNLLMIVLVLVMMAATIIAITATNYMTILAALGTVGFGVAIIFGLMSAPDLAITQLMVETLTVVLFMFVIMRLPAVKMFSSKPTLIRDAILSVCFGGVITILLLKAVNIQLGTTIADTLAMMSYPEAKGKNVVNVILVDFRALDTMGEIVVISAAALGISALVALKVRQPKEEKK